MEALLPGVAKKDISITTDDGRLTITANMQNEDEDVKHHLKEFSRTSKSRSFILPDEIDAACISASCCDGVLTLTLPKKKKKEAKKIQID